MARYIDADKVMEEIKRIGGHNLCGWSTIGVKALIDRQPTADVVEVKHGEWIDKPSGRYLHIASWCSVCGNKSGIGGIESNRHKPFCPNCGAKMDEKALKERERE